MKKIHGGFVMGLVLASLTGPAVAQPIGQPGSPPMGSGKMHQGPMMQGCGMMGPGMMGGWGSGYGMGPMMRGGPAQHIEGRIAFLRTELGITEAQTSLFNTYAEALRAAAKSMQGMHDQMKSGDRPDTVPERLTWLEQMMTAHLEALKKVRSAAVPLYNALSAEQKQTADSLMMGMGMGMGMM